MSIKKNGALLVGMGIFLSRIAGLLRERAFAHYFGNSDAGDAFKAALKIPNFLQNLFGEGVLSASFIPVYANLLANQHNSDGKNKNNQIDPTKVALTIGSLLFLVTICLVIIGIVATPFLITTIAPGFTGEKKELTIKLVQIIFPGTGLVVMSAWCLGILNAHRKFFLSYAAPVIWNFAIIFTILYFGKDNSQYDLVLYTGWGLVLGSFLQVAIQIPTTLKLLKYFRPTLDLKNQHVLVVVKNFIPGVISRGVVQISSYIDNILASLLVSGAVSNIAYAQTLYLLPVSLFGMSISASELPEMSSITGESSEAIFEKLRKRLKKALERVSFFIVPSVCAFIFNGDLIVAALFETGSFKQDDTRTVWLILIGFSIGLLASTLGRLYSSTFFSMKDTRTTLKFAIVRIILSTIFGYVLAFIVFPKLTDNRTLYVCGLTLSSSLCGWVEYYLLKRKLSKIIGDLEQSRLNQFKLWLSALTASGIAFLISHQITFLLSLHSIVKAMIVFSFFGFFYFALTYILKVEESYVAINKIKNKFIR